MQPCEQRDNIKEIKDRQEKMLVSDNGKGVVLAVLQSKLENVEKKVDTIISKIDSAFEKKADKDVVDSNTLDIKKISDTQLAQTRQALYQAIGIIVTLFLTLFALSK